jgi:hypothetical protein
LSSFELFSARIVILSARHSIAMSVSLQGKNLVDVGLVIWLSGYGWIK